MGENKSDQTLSYKVWAYDDDVNTDILSVVSFYNVLGLTYLVE